MTVDQATLDQMIEKARETSQRAYCRYSDFKVGASVLSDTGEIVPGCNVENASYGLTICAERNAVFRMVADGHQKIKAVVVYTPTPEPTAPCGACRQVINEFGPNARIVCVSDGEARIDRMISELLPEAFGPANL